MAGKPEYDMHDDKPKVTSRDPHDFDTCFHCGGPTRATGDGWRQCERCGTDSKLTGPPAPPGEWTRRWYPWERLGISLGEWLDRLTELIRRS